MKRTLVALAACAALSATARAADGADVYRSRCAGCHGKAAEGAKPRPEPIAGTSEEVVKRIVAQGRGRMKPLGLAPSDVDAVAKYVAGLPRP